MLFLRSQIRKAGLPFSLPLTALCLFYINNPEVLVFLSRINRESASMSYHMRYLELEVLEQSQVLCFSLNPKTKLECFTRELYENANTEVVLSCLLLNLIQYISLLGDSKSMLNKLVRRIEINCLRG